MMDDYFCRLNPFCDEDEIVLPERTPIEISLCGGNYFNCANRENTLEDALESDRFDDMLTARDKACMYNCMNPTRWPYKRIVECDDPDPCPSAGRLALHGAAEAVDAIPHEWLAEQAALWDAEFEFYSRVFGNERIFETVPEELKLWRRFIRKAREFHAQTSEAAGRFSAGEQAVLRDLPRPSQLSASEWAALIDRLDRLAAGTLPAGEWPEAAILAAAQRVELVRAELHRRGWVYRLDGLMHGLVQHSRKVSPLVGGDSFPRRGHYFVLRNLENGFEIRGRLSPNARIENVVLPSSSLFSVGYLDPESGAVGAAFFRSARVGQTSWLPTAPMELDSGGDWDGDGLSDLAESILGTSPLNPDTDGDGTKDGPEFRGGANALDGLVTSFGPIGRLALPGEAVELAADGRFAVVAGPGVGLAFVDVSDASRPVLLSRFDTPGTARRVVIHRGRLLVADGAGGLVVANHRPLDRGTNSPSVQVDAFTTSASPKLQESLSRFRAVARASDPDGIREVEFYIDGELQALAGRYPYAADLVAPAISAARREFTLQARAIDNSGQAALSEPSVIAMASDLHGPQVLRFEPPDREVFPLGAVLPLVQVEFDEVMDPGSLTAAWTLAEAGPDGRANTPDDRQIPATVHAVGPKTYDLRFAQPLTEGVYTLTVGTNVTDLAGNPARSAVSWGFAVRRVNGFAGPGSIWSSTASTRTNWSLGTLPTAEDFVMIEPSTDVPLVVLQNVFAASFNSGRALAFGGTNDPGVSTTLSLQRRAEFAAPVIIRGGGQWSGGESEVLDTLEIRSPESNFALNSHVLNNHGRVVVEKGTSSGILLRTTDGKSVEIHNLPGATWEQLGGSIIGQSLSPPSVFENLGHFIKSGPGATRIAVDHFLNPGEVSVQEGTLEFQGLALPPSLQAHVGTYRVAEGARLLWNVAGVTFGRGTRLMGQGAVEFASSSDFVAFPADLELGGSVTASSAAMSFLGRIDGPSRWQIGGPVAGPSAVRFTGQNQRSEGRFSVERNGELTIAAVTPVSLRSLVVSNELTLIGTLQVTEGLALRGARLHGNGVLRAVGAIDFAGQIQNEVGANPGGGRVEIAGAATCQSNTTVLVDGYSLAIQTSGDLELGSAKEFRLGRGLTTNEGTLRKTGPAVTRLSNGLVNRGVFEVLDGTLEFAAGGLFQIAGSTTLSTTGIVGQVRPITVESRHLNIAAGLFQAQGVVAFNSFTNSGISSPGTPVGVLDLQIGTHPTLSVFSQTSQGTLRIDVAGPEPGQAYDVLRTTGRAQLDGTLEIAALDSYDPPVGAEFVVLEASRVEGVFAIVRESSPRPGKRFVVRYEPTRAVLRVEAVAPANAGVLR